MEGRNTAYSKRYLDMTIQRLCAQLRTGRAVNPECQQLARYGPTSCTTCTPHSSESMASRLPRTPTRRKLVTSAVIHVSSLTECRRLSTTGGNTVFLHLFMDAFTLQPCNPTLWARKFVAGTKLLRVMHTSRSFFVLNS